MDKETEMAKQLLAAGKKKQALICLKKKKLQMTYMERAQGQLDNVSTMVCARDCFVPLRLLVA